MSRVDPDETIAATRRWLERFVIGLGLCPFAAAPFRAGRVHYRVCDAPSDEVIYQDFLATLEDFVLTDSRDQETLLLILSAGLRVFDDYLDLLAAVERALHDAGLEGVVQVASFHPDYCFAGAAPEDPANFTNRSPFPMFHLIRESDLAAALKTFPDPEAIPLRNVRRLRALGLAGIRQLLTGD